MLKRILILLVVGMLLVAVSPMAYGQAGQAEIATLAKDLAGRLNETRRTKVTALDFTDMRDRPNELGRYFAEQLANELEKIKGITVLNRRNIASIMAEHNLTADGLVKPENAKKLGQFAGVDAILVGTLTILDGQIVITVQAVSTETSEIVGGVARVQTTPDLQRMLGQSLPAAAGPGAATAATSANSAVTSEGEAIATRQLGPISVVLRNVAAHSIQSERGSTKAIRCTFDMENRDLQKSVAIAANQRVSEHENGGILKITGYRGDVVDSNQIQWTLHEARGISAVCCFEVNVFVRQPNPGGVVEAIRTAIKSAKGHYDQQGRYWDGSLGAIPPGETIRMTVDFVPLDDGGYRRADEEAAWPKSFQFDMELVTGTFAQGEDPLKSKDLLLRNLTIDRVVLPVEARPEK